MYTNIRKIVIAGLLLATGVILPFLFHVVGISGIIFSPMHIPVLLGGFILGPSLGALVGMLTPLLNFITTGAPPMPILWVMVIELGLYGLVTGTIYKLLKGKVIMTLIISMIIGRLGGALAAFILANLFNLGRLNGMMFLKTAVVTAWPGIVIQIILIPMLVKVYSLNSNNSI